MYRSVGPSETCSRTLETLFAGLQALALYGTLPPAWSPRAEYRSMLHCLLEVDDLVLSSSYEGKKCHHSRQLHAHGHSLRQNVAASSACSPPLARSDPCTGSKTRKVTGMLSRQQSQSRFRHLLEKPDHSWITRLNLALTEKNNGHFDTARRVFQDGTRFDTCLQLVHAGVAGTYGEAPTYKVQELMQKDLDVWIDGQSRVRSRTLAQASRRLAASVDIGRSRSQQDLDYAKTQVQRCRWRANGSQRC